jgi:hypothetical protein
MSMRPLNASAHIFNVHEAVVQHVIDVVPYAFDDRDTQILNPLTATRSSLALHGTNAEPATRNQALAYVLFQY